MNPCALLGRRTPVFATPALFLLLLLLVLLLPHSTSYVAEAAATGESAGTVAAFLPNLVSRAAGQQWEQFKATTARFFGAAVPTVAASTSAPVAARQWLQQHRVAEAVGQGWKKLWNKEKRRKFHAKRDGLPEKCVTGGLPELLSWSTAN